MGVASDIAIVKFDNQTLCVKFALPKLKVKANWLAPVHRNSAEYAWLEVVCKVAPNNAVSVKPNQVCTVSEAIDAFKVAMGAGWGTIVSARSSETEDVSISHLATGLGCEQLKVGSFQRSERMVNQSAWLNGMNACVFRMNWIQVRSLGCIINEHVVR